MNFRKYTYKTLTEIGSKAYECMAETKQAETKNLHFFWNDFYGDIQRELDRRTLAGCGDNSRVCLNDDIREAITAAGLKNFEVADFMGVSESTFSRLLRKPIDEERRQAILNAVSELA